MHRLVFPAIDPDILGAEIAACDSFIEVIHLIDSIATSLAVTAADDAGIPRALAVQPARDHIINALTA